VSIKLPFTMKEQVNLFKTADSLLVEVGHYRRSVILPVTLASKEPVKAEFKDDRLLVKFKEGAKG
jgi:arsenite-transporting ATPase